MLPATPPPAARATRRRAHPTAAALSPSPADDFRVIYDRECPFELRVQDAASDGPQQVGTLEAIKVKMLIQGEDAGPTGIRIELSRCVRGRVGASGRRVGML